MSGQTREVIDMTTTTHHAPRRATERRDRPRGGQSDAGHGMTPAERAIIAEMRAEIRAAMDRAVARLDELDGDPAA